MKKMSRKNFRPGPLFSTTKSSTTTASHSSLTSPGKGMPSSRRATWADKIREKLPPLSENEYEVLWERGVLGVIFLESEKDGIPYVSKATESCISSAVNQGDILKFVNVVRSKDHSFSDFFKILATMKKPVLLRFERLSASTPSSDDDDDDASQLFAVHRSSSTNTMNYGNHDPKQNAPHVDDADMASKIQRANSVPQKEQKTLKATRGTFWRGTGAKESANSGNSSQINGSNAVGGESDQVSYDQRRNASKKDHQVSPRSAALGNGSGGRLSHSPLGPHEYQVYWETGLLGLFFGENRSTSLPVVTRSTPSANPVVQRAVAVNDTLVSANGIKSADYTFEAFFGRLQQMNKPVRLVFRRRQPTDAAVIINQGEPQHQQQQQRQQQMREQEQKRELHKIRDQQESEQKQLREQEQQQRELHAQREQQMREQRQRVQQICEQKQREQQNREQKQQEQEMREQQQREQQQREDQRCRQDTESRNGTPFAILGTSQSSSTSPVESRTPHDSHTPIPSIKRASGTLAYSLSPKSVQLESDGRHHEHRHGRTPPLGSPLMSMDCANTRQRDILENMPSTNYQVSPKDSASLSIRSSPSFGKLSSKSPDIGSSPKVSSSPLTSPSSPFIATESINEASDMAPQSVVKVADEVPIADNLSEAERGSTRLRKMSTFENVRGNQSRNNIEEQRQNRKSAAAVHEEEPVLSPVSNLIHLSPTEPWDLPEHITSPKIVKVEAVDVDEEVDVGVSLSPNADIDMENVVMAKDAEFAVEAELFDEAELAEGAELSDEDGFAEAPLVGEDGSDEEGELADEVERILPVNYMADHSVNPGVEVGILAGIEMGIAIEENDSEVAESSVSGSDQNTSPWDLDLESDSQKIHHHSSNATSSRDEPLSLSSGSVSISNTVENSKVDFADASDPSDEFSHDPDISHDIDGVESDIMMQETPKGKMDAASVLKLNKLSLNANLAKYKKKGKTGRGVVKLPALSEDDALTIPLVAPNAVNTTIQVRGRAKPKLTMADTPDSTTFLIKWKENRSIGLQLKEVRFAKGIYPLVTDICHEPCCELLRHICIGDVIIEINGRNTSTMGVKKTVSFLKTCTKTTLMKIRHGPAYVNQRVSATV